MDQSRRNFLKSAAIIAAGTGVTNVNASIVERAFSINAKKGTTFYDAEHIVFLMQENRSFDHLYGCMKGVRGFNDPRIKRLPGGDKAWIQKDKTGNAIAPFHLDIHKTKITWQGGLPHSWKDQSLARNNGKYDQWIPQKTAMTMGYYNRNDMPFYYALADAFTICDHYFCSSLTGTTPNRLFFWTGNIRPRPDGNSEAAVNNYNAESRNNVYVDWETFPEILEDNGISWKIYQNELWTANLQREKDYWLGNYGDNAIEYVKRHKVKLSAYFRKNGDATVSPNLSAEEVLAKYNQLSQKEKNLIDKAFATNIQQDDYLDLEPFTFKNDQGVEQTVNIPKGDLLFGFRKDVENNTLPTVSWLVAPESFSDHTDTPYYGTWYVSQVLDILTQNPEVWKKTIFIINYDENDGYFDHIPPFVIPGGVTDGKVSEGIQCDSDWDQKTQWPIGLGYRVPCIVASPWSKGGYVNSEIYDHTSTLMFLEKILRNKTGKSIHCANISSWRRTICGDLTSVFRPYNGELFKLPEFLKREQVIESIQNAQNKPKQLVPHPLTHEEIKRINNTTVLRQRESSLFLQESGTRPACALPYRLHADCKLNKQTMTLDLEFSAENMTGAKGAPFNMYALQAYNKDEGKTWAFAVAAGNTLSYNLDLNKFSNAQYQLSIDGPNGFNREYRGDENDPNLEVKFQYGSKKSLSGKIDEKIILTFDNQEDEDLEISITDLAYNRKMQKLIVPSKKTKKLKVPLEESSGWYHFMLKVRDNDCFYKIYAGHVESGNLSITDPYMGRDMLDTAL